MSSNPKIIGVNRNGSGIELSIEDINLKKPQNSHLTAIRFDERYFTPKGASYRTIICICTCGTIFRTHLSSVTQGTSLSCGCIRRIQRLKRGYSISDINNKKPEDSRLTALCFSLPHITA